MRSKLECPGRLGLMVYLVSVISLGALCVNGQGNPPVDSSGKNSQLLRITIRTNPWVLQPSGQENSANSNGNNAPTENTQNAGVNASTTFQGGNPSSQQLGNSGNSGNNQWFNKQESSGNIWLPRRASQFPPIGQGAPVSFDLRNKESVSNVPQSKPPSTIQQSGSVPNNVASQPVQAQPNALPRQSSPDSVRNPLVPKATQANPLPVTPASTEQQVLSNIGQADPRTVEWNRQQILRQNMRRIAGRFNIWDAISRPPSTQSPPVLSRNVPTQAPSQQAFLQAIRNRLMNRESVLQPKAFGITQATQEIQPTQPPAQQMTQLPVRLTTRKPTTQSTRQRTQQPLLPLVPEQSRSNQVYPVQPWSWPGLGMSPGQQMWMFPFENQLENMPWFYRQRLLANFGTVPSGTGQSGPTPTAGQNSSLSGSRFAPTQTVTPSNTGPVMTTPRPVQPITPSIADRQRLAHLMLLSSYYERNCNQPIAMRGPMDSALEMAPPSGQGPASREPMACHCYPKRDCESAAFMYINPQTTRECATRVTGYTCCCEDPRPVV